MHGRAFVAAALPMLLAIAANAGCVTRQLAPDQHDASAVDGGATDVPVDGQSCPTGEPLPTSPCFTCDPLPAGADAGCGAPLPSIFGWDGGGIPDGQRYPVGCRVALPVENPNFPGGPQTCSCTSNPPDGGSGYTAWSCPI